MATIRLNIKALERLQRKNGWSDEDLCKKIGISRTQLWRLRLPPGDPRYNAPGETFIANVLKAFPDKYFEDLFFLDKSIAYPHKQNETKSQTTA